MGCLSVTIQRSGHVVAEVGSLHGPLEASVGAGHTMSACVTVASPLAKIRVRCSSKHITMACNMVCGVDMTRGRLYDAGGVMLFDADNKQLFEQE